MDLQPEAVVAAPVGDDDTAVVEAAPDAALASGTASAGGSGVAPAGGDHQGARLRHAQHGAGHGRAEGAAGAAARSGLVPALQRAIGAHEGDVNKIIVDDKGSHRGVFTSLMRLVSF